jgi:RNA polymerase sigma-70 factor, ECF subfamily
MGNSEEVRERRVAPELEAMLETHRPWLRVLAGIRMGRRLARKVDPSDVVQDALLRASLNIEHLRARQPDQVGRWLQRILASAVADALRRFGLAQQRDPRLERSVDEARGRSAMAIDPALLSPLSTPSQHAGRQEQLFLLRERMRSLPEHYQQVLRMRHWEGLSFREIAGRTGRSVDSVKHLWVRALAELRGQWGGRYESSQS